MTISRRVFVRAGGLALVSLGLDPLFLARAAFASRRPTVRPSDRPILVCLFQRGAVDGLNMIVPHGEPAYYQERPRIAIPATDVVDLDGHFGLHPSLAPLKALWDNKSLAAIHAIGSPDATRSHFDAQDYMETGTPGVKSTGDGWANRYCQHDRQHADTPFRAVAFGPQLPRILAGSAPSLAIDDLQAFGLPPPPLQPPPPLGRPRPAGWRRARRAPQALAPAGAPARAPAGPGRRLRAAVPAAPGRRRARPGDRRPGGVRPGGAPPPARRAGEPVARGGLEGGRGQAERLQVVDREAGRAA